MTTMMAPTSRWHVLQTLAWGYRRRRPRVCLPSRPLMAGEEASSTTTAVVETSAAEVAGAEASTVGDVAAKARIATISHPHHLRALNNHHPPSRQTHYLPCQASGHSRFPLRLSSMGLLPLQTRTHPSPASPCRTGALRSPTLSRSHLDLRCQTGPTRCHGRLSRQATQGQSEDTACLRRILPAGRQALLRQPPTATNIPITTAAAAAAAEGKLRTASRSAGDKSSARSRGRDDARL